MATAKQSQISVHANTAPGHRASEPRRTAAFVAGGVVVALVATGLALTGPGGAVASRIFHFLEFYTGVFSLVALSITVMVGLAATDRIVLMVRHRVLMQGVHRALAIAAMVFLGIHVATKIIEGHASFVDVLVPFLASHRAVYVGLGTLASYLMIGVTITGVVRGRFAGSQRVWLWRALHAAAYLAWPDALLHGLNAGRPAATWVTVSYVLCLIVVGLGALVRVCVLYGNRLRAPRTQTTATLRAVGKTTKVASASGVGAMAGAPAPALARERRDTGSLPPVRDPFTDTGTARLVRDSLRETGTTPPVRDRVRDTGTMPPVRDRVRDTGTMPPVRDRVRDTGTMPPVRDRVRDTGTMPPVRDRSRDTGSMPPVREGFRDTGTPQPAGAGFRDAGITPPPVQDRVRDTGTMPPVRDRSRDTGSMPPVRDRTRDTGSMPPLRDSDIPRSPVVPSPAPVAARGPGGGPGAAEGAPAGSRGPAAGRRPEPSQRPGGAPIVSDDDFWAFMRGEGER
jgi:hypothetical protein